MSSRWRERDEERGRRRLESPNCHSKRSGQSWSLWLTSTQMQLIACRPVVAGEKGESGGGGGWADGVGIIVAG